MKNNNTVPVYRDYPCSLPPLKFKSSVEFIYSEQNYLINSDILCSSKKKAQNLVALKAVSQLQNEINKTNECKYKLENKKSYIVFVDYDNYNNDSEIETLKKNNEKISILTVSNNLNPKKKNADKIINSNKHDVVDIYICCKIGEINSIQNGFELIIIITKDHFASCLTDIYDNCRHVTSIEECAELIVNREEKIQNRIAS